MINGIDNNLASSKLGGIGSKVGEPLAKVTQAPQVQKVAQAPPVQKVAQAPQVQQAAQQAREKPWIPVAAAAVVGLLLIRMLRGRGD